MRQTHKLNPLALALSLGSALICASAQAENITYPGATLESVSVGSKTYSNTLAPTSATAANNTVTVISLGSSAAPDFIFGGWHDTEKVSKNTLIIKEAVLAGTPIAGGMGLGDVKLALVVGGLTADWATGMLVVLLAALLSAIAALVARSSSLPHGPALVGASALLLAVTH